MNRETAKHILQSRRPSGQDDQDPQIAEALALAESDPELKQWFEDQHAFDAALAQHMQSTPLPADLKQKVLATRPVTRVWPVGATRRVLAMAACLTLFATLGGV